MFFNNLKIGKKGIIEVSFSWIFILMAGVAILSLFSYIGVKQGTFFTDKLHGKLLLDLSSIFIGSQVSRNTAAIINIPTSEIRFECDGFKTGRVNYPFSGFVVFAPSKIKTDKLITWSRGWGIGYRVINFLYITAPNIKYYIIYNNASSNARTLAMKLYEEFPDVKVEEYKQNKEIGCSLSGCVAPIRIKDEGYTRINILMVGFTISQVLQSNSYSPNTDLKDYANDEITFVYASNIAELSDDIFASDITFKDKSQAKLNMDPSSLTPVFTQRIIDKSTVFGAFISGDPTMFQCMTRYAYEHAKPVTELYIQRTLDLSGQARPLCQSFYTSQGLPYLNDIKNALSGTVNADLLTTKQLALAQLNNQLERTSCPQLY